jgi:hypothetical protein
MSLHTEGAANKRQIAMAADSHMGFRYFSDAIMSGDWVANSIRPLYFIVTQRQFQARRAIGSDIRPFGWLSISEYVSSLSVFDIGRKPGALNQLVSESAMKE